MFRYLILWILSITLVCGERAFTLQRDNNVACFQIKHYDSNTAIKIQNLRSESLSIPYSVFEFDDPNKYTNIPELHKFLNLSTTVEESDFLFLDEYGRLEVKLQLNETSHDEESDTAHYGLIESDTTIPIPRDGHYCIYFPWAYHDNVKVPEEFQIDITIINERVSFPILFWWLIFCMGIIIFYSSYVKGETFAHYSKCTKLVLYFYSATVLKEVIILLVDSIPHFDGTQFIRQEIITYFNNLSTTLIKLYMGWINIVIFMGYGSLYRFKMPSFVLRKSFIVSILDLLTNFPGFSSILSDNILTFELAYLFIPRILVGKDFVIADSERYISSFGKYLYYLSGFLLSIEFLFEIAQFMLTVHYSISTYRILKKQGKLAISKRFKVCSLFYFIGSPLVLITYEYFVGIGADVSKVQNISDLINELESASHEDALIVYHYFHLLFFWMIWANDKYEVESENNDIELSEI
ncbi:hypothetical protein DFJ63DRAFT_310924 [Scheffersomyces coipomensis]|uniref:uncharacterized protein n=1 Tax=Scheffersomyces coipomensis TaxID=1788519 RepID=UPI00315C9E45